MKTLPKILISLLLVSIIPMVVFTFIANKRWSDLIEQEQLGDLTEILKSRELYIKNYFEDMKTRVGVASRTDNVIDGLTTMNPLVEKKEKTSDAYIKEAESLFKFLHYLTDPFNINQVLIVNKKGTIIFALQNTQLVGQDISTGPYANTELHNTIQKVSITNRVELSSFSLCEACGGPAIFVGAPIIDKGIILGTLVFQIPPTEVYQIFQNYTSLKDTGEVLIGTKQGDKILFVNPIRHKPDAAFNFTIPLGSDIALPMQNAVQRIGGKGISVDYRDKKIIAIWDYFPLMDWGIVIKIDYEEALKPVKSLQRLLLMIAIITVLIVILIALFIARVISNPIVELQQIALEIGKGNLNTPIQVTGGGETADLAKAFQQMQQNLKESTTSIENLNREVKMRQEMEKVRKEQYARISHELRTPLGPIQEGVRFVLSEKEGKLNDIQKELLNLANQNVERLTLLVNEILQVQEMQVQKPDEHFTELDLNKIMQDVTSRFQEKAKQKNLSFELKSPSDLPHIKGNASQIIEALSHLIDNAIKFTDQGSVSIECTKNDQEVRIQIRDTGIGISPEDQQKLFQDFRELGIKSGNKKQGAGIGLFLANKIITNHRGKIEVNSTLNQGSTFTVVLPINGVQK